VNEQIDLMREKTKRQGVEWKKLSFPCVFSSLAGVQRTVMESVSRQNSISIVGFVLFVSPFFLFLCLFCSLFVVSIHLKIRNCPKMKFVRDIRNYDHVIP